MQSEKGRKEEDEEDGGLGEKNRRGEYIGTEGWTIVERDGGRTGHIIKRMG